MQIRKYDVREATALVENADSCMASCNRNNNESCVVCLEELLNGQVRVLLILCITSNIMCKDLEIRPITERV